MTQMRVALVTQPTPMPKKHPTADTPSSFLPSLLLFVLIAQGSNLLLGTLSPLFGAHLSRLYQTRVTLALSLLPVPPGRWTVGWSILLGALFGLSSWWVRAVGARSDWLGPYWGVLLGGGGGLEALVGSIDLVCLSSVSPPPF